MESEDAVEQLRQSLRDADRAEAAPWADYPPSPRGYPPATGVWAALLSVWAGAALALVGVTGVVAWYERAYAAASDRTRKRLA
jgi:hypothetical protein